MNPTTISQRLLSEEPVVRLENYFQDAYNNAVATARTCYSSRVIGAQDVVKDEETAQRRDEIAESIYKAGHHTTLQHATFQFVLDKVSRQFLWSFLHSHPYYNSEQVSQRYVEVRPERFTVPPLEEREERLYRETIQLQMDAYHRLIALLEPVVRREYATLFPARNPQEKKWQGGIKKKAMEIARYALPVATHAHLYHTVSGITLHRYHRLCDQLDTPLENRIVVEKMVEEVNKVDPEFFKFIEETIPLEQTLEYQLFRSFSEALKESEKEAFIREFDEELGPYSSRLVDYKFKGEESMAQAIRSVLGLSKKTMTDEEAISLVMDPAQDPYLAQSLTLTTMSKLTRTMNHPHFTFKKKLSHTADSQDQRHRMTPGSRPLLGRHFRKKPDYIVPVLVKHDPEALAFYHKTMAEIWKAIEMLLNLGLKEEYALYLLPNAFPIRFEESGDLLNFHHKWVQRLCYLAQEEIWKSCLEEVRQVRDIFPNIGSFIAAPCWIRERAGVRPACPEGERFCGVKFLVLSL